MKTIIVGRKFEASENFKATIDKKLAKLDKFFADETEVNVTLSRNRGHDRVELTVFYKSTIFRAEVDDDDMLSALDKAVSILERQIRKNKTKLEKRLRSGAFEETADEDALLDIGRKEYEISKVKRFTVEEMTPDEAILQMELSDHEFFLFRNNISGEINLVYKKQDDEYGLIIPS